MAKVTVVFEAKDSDAACLLIDAINEFGRNPEVDELLARTTGPSGDPEGDWTIVAEEVR